MDSILLMKVSKSIADAAGKIADLFNPTDEVKKELLKPAAGSLGNRFKRFINKNQGLKRAESIVEEAYLKNLSEQTAKYFVSHPNATLDESKRYLIYKQIDDSMYSINDEYMRSRFAKLLANTADKGTNSNISPLYSHILSNLSPKTAKLLLILSQNKLAYTPAIFIRIINGASNTLYPSKTYINPSLMENVSTQIWELYSLGLIKINEEFEVTDNINPTKDLYMSIEKYLERVDQDIQQYGYYKNRGVLYLTEFGRAFVSSIQ